MGWLRWHVVANAWLVAKSNPTSGACRCPVLGTHGGGSAAARTGRPVRSAAAAACFMRRCLRWTPRLQVRGVPALTYFGQQVWR